MLDLTSDVLEQIIAAIQSGVVGVGGGAGLTLPGAIPPSPIVPPGGDRGAATGTNIFNFGGNTISDPLYGAAFESNVLRVVRQELKNA